MLKIEWSLQIRVLGAQILSCWMNNVEWTMKQHTWLTAKNNVPQCMQKESGELQETDDGHQVKNTILTKFGVRKKNYFRGHGQFWIENCSSQLQTHTLSTTTKKDSRIPTKTDTGSHFVSFTPSRVCLGTLRVRYAFDETNTHWRRRRKTSDGFVCGRAKI